MEVAQGHGKAFLVIPLITVTVIPFFDGWKLALAVGIHTYSNNMEISESDTCMGLELGLETLGMPWGARDNHVAIMTQLPLPFFFPWNRKHWSWK